MKLLLDELWPPAITEQLRRRGIDAVPPFKRHKGSDFVVGPMVCALDYFVGQLRPEDEPLNRPHWLRAAAADHM